MTFWYNVNTRQVEPDETKSAGDNLMGPYDTREEAQRALQTARRRPKPGTRKTASGTRVRTDRPPSDLRSTSDYDERPRTPTRGRGRRA